MAVGKLLSIQPPYQILHLDATLSSRVEFVGLLTNWSNAEMRPQLVHDSLPRLLTHLTCLAEWLEDVSAPRQHINKLIRLIVGDVTVSVDVLVRVDEKLKTLDDYWADSRSATDNLEYLYAEYGKARRTEVTGADGTVTTVDNSTTATRSARETSELVVQLTEQFQQGLVGTAAEAFAAIDAILHSLSMPAVRWLLGHAPITRLPKIFHDMCSAFPNKLDEYVVDSLKHADDGSVDTELDGITVYTFYNKSGSSQQAQRAFFLNLYAGKLTAIDWEKHFVQKIAVFLDPNAPAFASLTAAYLDADRRGMHRVYVGRLFEAFDKPAQTTYSLSGFFDFWVPTLTTATRCGTRADCLREIETLVTAAWTTAEHMLIGNFTKATPWNQDLFDGTCSAFSDFTLWADEMKTMGKMAKRFRLTMSSMASSGAASSSNAALTHRQRPVHVPNQAALSPPGNAPRIDVTRKAVVQDGWLRHGQYAMDDFHVAKCTAVIKTMGYSDQCLAVVTSRLPTLQAAATYCEAGHAWNASQHSLWNKQSIFFGKLDETCRRHVMGRRQQAIADGSFAPKPSGRGTQKSGPGAGKGRGKGAGKGKGKGGGKGTFRRQTVRSST